MGQQGFWARTRQWLRRFLTRWSRKERIWQRFARQWLDDRLVMLRMLVVWVGVMGLSAWLGVTFDKFETTTVLLAAVTIPITIYGFSIAARINLKNKIMDCVIGCNLRYDDLYKERSRIAELQGTVGKDIEYVTQNYYNRYWGLKSDQFDYWLSGYVDPETMCSWFYSVMKAFATDPEVGGVKFSYGWQTSSAYHRVADPTFDVFIAELIKVAEQNRARIQKEKFSRQGGIALYRQVVKLFADVEKEYAPTITEMTNMPLQFLIAPRQRMDTYRAHYDAGARKDWRNAAVRRKKLRDGC